MAFKQTSEHAAHLVALMKPYLSNMKNKEWVASHRDKKLSRKIESVLPRGKTLLKIYRLEDNSTKS